MAQTFRSNFPGPLIRDRVGRMPSGGGADAVAACMDIQEIGAPIDIRPPGAVQRRAYLRRLRDDLTFDPEGRSGLGEVHIRVAVVAGHVAAGLELPAGAVPNPVALIIV